ncbi:hypothetical protein ACOSQ4_002694 [Xanthoceras sorbifolium]
MEGPILSRSKVSLFERLRAPNPEWGRNRGVRNSREERDNGSLSEEKQQANLGKHAEGMKNEVQKENLSEMGKDDGLMAKEAHASNKEEVSTIVGAGSSGMKSS